MTVKQAGYNLPTSLHTLRTVQRNQLTTIRAESQSPKNVEACISERSLYLLQHATSISPVCIDLFDEVGIAGGASGVAGGLLHAFTNKGEEGDAASVLPPTIDCDNVEVQLGSNARH